MVGQISRERSPYRFYRERHRKGTWSVFRVTIEQTDLWIRADSHLRSEAVNAVVGARYVLQRQIERDPLFLHSLDPLPNDPQAPMIVQAMIRAGRLAGVGPMAAVAGAIAEQVARHLSRWSRTVIVENGGDCYIVASHDLHVAVYPGPLSPFREGVTLFFPRDSFPVAVCTSSGVIGHSMSTGRADAATVVARDGALADACATALGNRIRSSDDIEPALGWIRRVPGIRGALVMFEDRLAIWGKLELAGPCTG